ncbi:MAG: 16S rRNA (cytosine(1402)-N(4))-methyltransferase RsmH [Candidatus Saccharibacteria bacterium]|nr:16S rRNA (cytosine(1402)-N(4))-methyltransferase RsmH [Candidatus Saccharibacteria bacterium]
MEKHIPVLLSEVLEVLAPQPGESYLDLTAGYAGHASEILAITQNYKNSVLVDRDENAIKFLKAKYSENEDLEILHQDFYSAVLFLAECGRKFDMILMDLGVSSPQLDEAERGFSFQKSGPLDMRMDGRQKYNAATIVNHASVTEMAGIFVKFGEMRAGAAARLAKEIIRFRPYKTTTELANVIAFHRKSDEVREWRGGRHPATLAFQAIRIAVNQELEILSSALAEIPRLLNPGGRMAVISFHSLEDRIVKEFFRNENSMGAESRLMPITKKPIRAEEKEVDYNPRARSAVLRGERRLD